MSTIIDHSPVLPWADSAEEQGRFRLILWSFVALTLIIGAIVPNIKLPEIERAQLEKLPAQLARVIQKKKELPKPKPKPKIEKKVEEKPKPEVKPKPKPKPEVKVKPKPKPKPKPVPKKERSPEKVKKAKAKAKKLLGNTTKQFADMRQSMKSMMPSLASNKGLNNKGNAAVASGSVINKNLAGKTSGGVNVAALSRDTGGQELGSRDTTEIEEVAEIAQATEEVSGKRSKEELRIAMGALQPAFDTAFQRALRKDPTIEGMILLTVVVEPEGNASSCTVAESELNNKKLEKKIAALCKFKLSLAERPVEQQSFTYPIKLIQ
jgi:outer membrane biosynthesis protein TonB